jgi:uncharacterized protein (TIGR03437 family)
MAAYGADPAWMGYPAEAVATDADGNLYLAGSTKSLALPVKNAHQPRPGESQFLKSEDLGATWKLAGSLPSDPPTALAADPVSPGLLYAGGLDGIHKSTDGGLTWRLVRAAPMVSYPGVLQIAVDPVDPRRVFAIGFGEGLLRSDDRGETWERLTADPYASPFDRIAIDPHGSGMILSTILYPGISRDGGKTWEPLAGPAGFGSPRLAVFDPHQQGRIYLSTAAGTLGQFHLSTDYGKTWQSRTNPPDAIYHDLVVDPERPEVLYAATLVGFARSDNGGIAWKRVEVPSATLSRIAVPPRNCGAAGTLVAATGSGAVRSIDAGDTWTNLGISGAVTVTSGAGCTLWMARAVAAEGFVAKISPEGETLWATYLGGSDQETVRRIAVDAQGNVTVAGTTSSRDFPGDAAGTRGFGDIFITRFDRNGAVVYSKALAGSRADELTSLAIDDHGSALLAGRSYAPDFPFTQDEAPEEGGSGFVARFDSAGTLLYATAIPAPLVVISAPVVAAPASNGRAWVGTYDGQVLTLDAGGSVVDSRALCEKCTVHVLTTRAGESLYVAGMTTDPDFPVTPGTYRTGVRSASCNLSNRFSFGPGDLFLMKFEAGEAEPALSALIGTDCQTIPDALLVGEDGGITISAQTLAQAFPLRRPLTGSPIPGAFTGAVLQLSAGARDLLFATYTETLAAPGIAQGPGEAVYIGSRLVDLAAEPQPRLDRVLHAFNGSPTVPPGGLVMLRGDGIGPPEWNDLGLNALQRLPLELGGTEVRFDGRTAPILLAGSDRIVCVAPAELPLTTAAEVFYRGVPSNRVLMRTFPAAGLLTRMFPNQPPYDPQLPPPDGVVRNEDGTLNDPENPARPSSLITVFFTGLPLRPSSPVPGSIATDESEAGQVWGLWHTIGRTPATPAHLVSGFVSALQQATFTVPASASGRMVLQLYSRNPEFNPRATADTNAIGVWVR